MQGKTVPSPSIAMADSCRPSLHLPGSSDADDFDMSKAGIFLQFVQGPIGVEQMCVRTRRPQHAGLQAGDSIAAVDGHAFHTVLPLLDYMQSGQGKPITLDRRSQRRDPAADRRPSLQLRIRDGAWDSCPSRRRDSRCATEPCSLLSAVDRVARLLRGEFPADCGRAAAAVHAPGFGHAAFRPGGHCAHAAGQAAEMKDW